MVVKMVKRRIRDSWTGTVYRVRERSSKDKTIFGDEEVSVFSEEARKLSLKFKELDRLKGLENKYVKSS